LDIYQESHRTFAALLAIVALGETAVPAAFAGQGEGPGNGSGQSRQCTGPQTTALPAVEAKAALATGAATSSDLTPVMLQRALQERRLSCRG